MPVQPDFPAPSKLLLLLEGRAFSEYCAYWLAQPWLKKLPKGDGHPVVVLPGFGTSDWHTIPLRRFLKQLGYATHGWKLGRNLGMNGRVREGLGPRLEELYRRYDSSKVTLIGWSLGGVFARELARRQPDKVRAVITLGSPFNVSPSANNVDSLFRRANPGFRPDLDCFARRIAPPPVPCVAIHSKSDGIVAWQCSQEESADNTENIEVFSSHFGMGFNPLVLREIAYKLKQLSAD
jgi:pimeloyl-ACP methyl ester carboxylesterase